MAEAGSKLVTKHMHEGPHSTHPARERDRVPPASGASAVSGNDRLLEEAASPSPHLLPAILLDLLQTLILSLRIADGFGQYFV